MDPISVTASIITLITAAGSIVRCLEHVKSRMNPSAELFSIMNTVFPTQLLKSIGGQVLQLQVTALQATLVVVRYENEALKNCRIPAAALAYKGLPDTIERLQQYIDRLVDFAHSNLLNKGKGLSRLGLSKGKRKALTRIQDDISDAHRNLQILLHTANLRRNQELLSKIEQASLVQDTNHMQTSTTLDEVITRLSAAQITGVGDSGGSQQTQNEFESMLAQTTPDSSNATSTHLSVTTSLPLKACDWTCNCQCHVQTRSQTPQWLSAVVGTLFYASTRTPSLDIRPCNNTNCFRTHPSSSCRLTYYFPSWIMRTVLVCATWNKLEGMNSSWMVTMPREIPLYSACWHFIESGSLGKVRDLLQSRQMSPYDIGPDGVSVLHWAESRWQFEICSLLTAMGANWHFMDRSGRSPSDGAWRKILMNDDSNASVMKFRALVGSDDSKDLQLGPLHRIILGLSSIDFTMQLDLEPSRVNDADWLGVTPLMWAALRNNHTYIGLLLLHGARPDLKDSEGRTALHHAARVGSIRCVDALLGAGADPNTVDNRGFTPLHDVAFSVESTETANMIISLHSHCANIEARDEMGRSPVFIASLTGSQTALKTLIECRADVNALDFVDVPPIVLAILRGHGEIVRQLFSAGAMPSWGPVDHIVDNVLIKAALNGTKEMMDILADSAIPPIECDIPRIRHYFQTYRKVLYGAPCSPEEELAAFQRLLDKKAIALTCAENSDLPEETNSVSRKESDEYHDSNDEDAVVDVFEDAQENMSCLHESTLLETLPVVVST